MNDNLKRINLSNNLKASEALKALVAEKQAKHLDQKKALGD